jgi:hypothetical protein
VSPPTAATIHSTEKKQISAVRWEIRGMLAAQMDWGDIGCSYGLEREREKERVRIRRNRDSCRELC